MNEQEFREALRGVMVASSPPPSMDGMAVLEAARSVRRRRQTMLASAGTAVAIAAIAVGAVLAAGPSGWLGGQFTTGGPPSQSGTETVWPTGADGQPQQDRTATGGPRADQSVRLESELAAVLPSGFTVAPDQAQSSGMFAPRRYHQAQFVDRVDGREVWEYYSLLPITKDGKTGLLFAMVQTPGNTLPDDLCTAAKTLWGSYSPDGQIDMGWQCQETAVGSNKVGVISGHNGGSRFDQWSYYRHPDGTSVFVAQSAAIADSNLPPLPAQPLTLDTLAALAADPRFHLE